RNPDNLHAFLEKLQGNGLRAFATDADNSVNSQFTSVGDNFIRNILDAFPAILDGAVLKRVTAIRGAQDSPTPGQNTAHELKGELIRLLWPDESVEAIWDANDSPLIFQECTFDRGANDCVEAGCIATASANPDTSDICHCTVMVNGPLVMPLRLAVTVVVAPEVAVESTAPLPLVIVVMTALLLLLQVT